MKILMSALACEPGKGSELEVGFRAVLAAATRHDVWVLTNKDTIPAVARALEGRAEGRRIHLEGIEFGVDADGIRLLTVPGFHVYYDRWQRKTASRAVELDRAVNFDVVHHVTLAAYWTRTGVAVLDKPLVWGPVGGGVEPPLSLIGELGWRGVIEDIGRVFTRRLLGSWGPARDAQRRAGVIFAQNSDTLRRIRSVARVSVLTNATAIDPGEVNAIGPRTPEVLFVGRLVGWKAPMLALKAFRHVARADARLIFCGDGYERARLARCAKRWGIADRVTFEGWLPRHVLLSRLATAGVLLHPSLHEEAGLCVAEALALGTPVVCLDHGGPPEILRQWPATPSAAVPPAARDITARRLAAAMDRFLGNLQPVARTSQASATSFENELLSAYEYVVRLDRSANAAVWGFPRGKPQIFSESPRSLSRGVQIYAFGRRIPKPAQAMLALQVRIPGLRRLVAQQCPKLAPACGWDVWQAIVARLSDEQSVGRRWLHLHSQWHKARSSAIALNGDDTPEFFLTIEPSNSRVRGPLINVTAFRIPACTAAFTVAGWLVRKFELLPAYHRPAGGNLNQIRRVAEDASRALTATLGPAPDGTPAHWRPMHGDLVPWNLREDDDGQLWLMDWEDAGFGPPLADILRFIVAKDSLRRASPDRIAVRVRELLASEPHAAIQEAALFWLQHPNLRPADGAASWEGRKAREAARGVREVAAFTALAQSSVGVPPQSHSSHA